MAMYVFQIIRVSFGASKSDPLILLALNNFLPLLDLCDAGDKADLAKFILLKVLLHNTCPLKQFRT